MKTATTNPPRAQASLALHRISWRITEDINSAAPLWSLPAPVVFRETDDDLADSQRDRGANQYR